MMSRDASLSDSHKSGHCCFSEPEAAQVDFPSESSGHRNPLLSESKKIKLNLDQNYTFPIDLAPNKNSFDAKFNLESVITF